MSVIEGRVWKFGDDIDTDGIVPGRYLIGELQEIAQHVMDGARPGFAAEVCDGDIVVAGTNFGSGSSREMAARALQAAGIRAVVAVSFARIFFRNCINVGLVPVECPTAGVIEEGQTVRVDVEVGRVEVTNTGDVHDAVRLPHEIALILNAGGLEPYLAAELGTT
ncbi:MAG TPA: 3-isopropylmalate dehydratase small subunit [Acidimicrobiia bacterium]|nr:3-isopropylmalate dehydratase small subunit [Acidimicrobiia bacterium]